MSLQRVVFLVGLSTAFLVAGAENPARAQADFFEADTGLDLPLADYMAKAGPGVKLIEAGKLEIDGRRMECGKRPTVIDPNFESWGGAYPGYLILNTDKMKNLPTSVKQFVYAHECGHQFVSRDEGDADCFGIRRGRRNHWLKEDGLAQVCNFISGLKGDAEHAAGPLRCLKMRRCYLTPSPGSLRR